MERGEKERNTRGAGASRVGKKGEERLAREKPELDILGVGVLIRVSRSSRISRTGRREKERQRERSTRTKGR